MRPSARLALIAACALAAGALAADLAHQAGWRLERPGYRAARQILVGEDQAEDDLGAADQPIDRAR